MTAACGFFACLDIRGALNIANISINLSSSYLERYGCGLYRGALRYLLMAQTNPQIITPVGKPYGYNISYLSIQVGFCQLSCSCSSYLSLYNLTSFYYLSITYYRLNGNVSTVEVTVRYHLMTHTLFLAIVCLTTYFYYLFITYYRLSGNIDLVAIE
jgi:hypothetical protein